MFVGIHTYRGKRATLTIQLKILILPIKLLTNNIVDGRTNFQELVILLCRSRLNKYTVWQQ